MTRFGSLTPRRPVSPPALSRLVATALLFAASLSVLPLSRAQAADPIQLTLSGHKFQPDHVTVPNGERFRIEVTNKDDTTAEFESYDMKFEKIVAAGGHIFVYAGPLHPGTFKFFDDYHPDTATGTVTAEAK